MSDRPLKILFWYWGRRGGGPRYTYELARAMSQRYGVELHLSLSRQSELFAETEALGLKSCHVDTYSSAAQFALRSARIPRLGAQVRRYIREERIDVVYNTMDFLWGSALAPQISRSGALYLLAVHDAQRHPGEDGRLRSWLLTRDIAAADGAITMTEAVRERLIDAHQFPKERSWTAPLGGAIDAITTSPRILPLDRPARLLFFGRILPYKGLDVALAALPIIRAAHPGTELEIHSSGDIAPYRGLLEQTEGVRLNHGWIGEDDIPAIFCRTDVCVLPYSEASQSGVIALAMAAGMPVVTTPLPGPVEQIAHGSAGRIASGFDHEAFADAVVSLIGSPNVYARASASAVDLSNGVLAWTSIAGLVENAARSLVSLGPKAL